MSELINVYIDMDGVQTVYDKSDTVEEMMQEGYFSSRQPHKEVIDFIKSLIKDDRYTVTVLSAVFTDSHSVLEKAIWLEEQGLSSVDKMFVPCGVPKSNYVKSEEMNILIDDFSKNLFEWENAGKNFFGIKFMNEANGENGTWRKHAGASLDYSMNAIALASAFERIIKIWKTSKVA